MGLEDQPLGARLVVLGQLADRVEELRPAYEFGEDRRERFVHDVARGMGMDNRIGRKFLHPGPGYGGSCFPKDLAALSRMAAEHGTSLHVLDAVSAVNDEQKRQLIHKVIERCRMGA